MNPLMAMYFSFDLAAGPRRSRSTSTGRGHGDILQVAAAIERFRDGVDAGRACSIPD